jgi:hypothetical protein
MRGIRERAIPHLIGFGRLEKGSSNIASRYELVKFAG